MRVSLFVVTHPDFGQGFIASTRQRAQDLIDSNMSVWKERNIDERLFVIEDYAVRDNTLIATLQKGMPELFL